MVKMLKKSGKVSFLGTYHCITTYGRRITLLIFSKFTPPALATILDKKLEVEDFVNGDIPLTHHDTVLVNETGDAGYDTR